MISKTLLKEIIKQLDKGSEALFSLSTKPKDLNLANRMTKISRRIKKHL